MQFKVVTTPPDSIAIVKTALPVDLAKNIFASHRSAKAAVGDQIDARIRALRRIRDEAVAVPENKLPTDETVKPVEAV